jgi:hypothetical protein
MSGFLCSMVGATFASAASRTARTVTAVGNAQVDTAQSKFGGASYLGDGNGDYLTCETAADLSYGSGGFTFEFWMRIATTGVLYVPFAQRSSGAVGNGDWWCELGSNNKIYWGLKNTAGTQYYVNLAQAEATFSANVWYHIALVRNGNSVTYYRDGVATGGSETVTGSFGGNDNVFVGALGPGGYNFNGHIDEVRISNTARYTAGFTPSASAFTNDANTLLLLHCNGTDASTTFTDDNA